MQDATREPCAVVSSPRDNPSLDGLIQQLGSQGHSVVMVMGKGGVGKMIIAAATLLMTEEILKAAREQLMVILKLQNFYNKQLKLNKNRCFRTRNLSYL